MLIKTAQFIGSFTKVSQCPNLEKPEYAFIGRSNVGKSSLINMLTNHKKLAKVSNTPGKTQTINHFLINETWYLVDLPGYGYARASKTSRKTWEKFIRNYFMKRTNLQCVFLLIDSRLEPQKIDLEFANSLGEMRIPFVLVYTKSDKIKPQVLKKNIEAFEEAMKETWHDLPQSFTSSSKDQTGKDELLTFIDSVNQKILPLQE